MKKIPVENIENEMVLAKDVTGSSGNALLGKGTSLTVSIGRRLKNWGIDIVCIEGDEESRAEEIEDLSSPEENRNILEERFSGVLSNPLMDELFEAVLEFQNTQRQ